MSPPPVPNSAGAPGSKNLVFYGPSGREGGTTLLLARVAAEFSRRGFPVRIVDFADGRLAAHLSQRGLPFVHTLPDEAGNRFEADELVVLILLHAKLLLRGLRPHPQTRFFFWSTHPQDGFKLLPGANLVRREDDRTRHIGGRLMHPRYWRRVRAFLEEGARRSGVVYMDSQNSMASQRVFSLDEPRTILPVATEDAEAMAPPVPGPLRRVTWVGRLEHFKTESVLHAMRTLEALGLETGDPVRFDVIGHGAARQLLEAEAARLQHVKVIFHGTRPSADIETHLRHHADLLVGHGMSLLEGARLGLPSLTVDGFLIAVPTERVLARWLHDEPDGEVGRIIEAEAEQTGQPLRALLKTWWAPEARAGLGAAARRHWERTHRVGEIANRALELFEANTFTWARIEATGFSRLDASGRVIERVKQVVSTLRRRWADRG